MAVGTGFGINLDELNNAFKKADEHIKKLTDETNGLQKTTINAFQQMAKSGVLPYVESLKQQKKYLEEIANSTGKSKLFKEMQREAKTTIDEINKVISSLEKTKSFRNEASGKSAMSFAKSVLGKGGEAKSIDNMREALRRLEDAQNRQNLGTARGRQNYEKIGNTIRRVKEELDKATGSNKKLTEESQKTQSAFEKLGGVITAAFAINTLKRFVNQMISIRGEFEMQHRSLQVLIGDIDEANLLWEKTVDLAVKSPFRVKDLVTYTKQLAAYRVESDKLYETNKMLADISAGLGVDMNRLILAFGQVKAANFLRGTELRQFSEAGVNMLEELAKRFTMIEGRVISVGEVFERVSKRMVSFRDVEEVLKSITSEGGTFYQMQEKQSETLKGMIMNLKDSIDLAFNEMGESTESVTKKAVNAVRNLVDNWEKFRPVISGITVALVSTLVGVGVAKVITGFKLAGQAVMELFTLIKTGSMAASLGAGPWVALFAIVTGVIVAITQAIGSANKLQKELNKIYAEDTGNLDKSIARYQDLVNRLREANQGSEERRDIVEKLNNEYGKYLDFIVTEQTEIEQLVESYDILVKRMKEKAAAATYEKAFGEISDKYSKKIQEAREELEDALEVQKVSIQGKDIFTNEKGAGKIVPTEKEINDIYRIIEQRLQNINAEEAKRYKTLAGQQQLLRSIVAGYYGEEYTASFAKSSDATKIIDVLLERKEKELEIEEQISLAYKDSLNSRKARLEYEKLELEYAQKQAEVRAMPNKSQFEVNKMLNKLKEEFELNKIEIKFKFGQIGDEERERLRNNLLNWATDTTKDVNNEIRRQLSDFMKEEEWSNFLITQDQQAQGISGIIKEITNGYETQVGVIKEQLSLKTAGRKIDEKGLEYAQRQAKAYEAVADILGIELKTQDRISEELRKQINDLMPEKQKISLEDSYKSVKEIQEETNKEYKAQVEVMTTLINQKRAGMDIDYAALEASREDLEMLHEKMKLLGMKVEKPVSETTRNSINYFLPEEFKISEVDALAGITKVNQEAAKAFEDAQKELGILQKMQDQQVEGLEDEILLLQSQLPYLQRKVELTGTEIKDRLSELQLIEINAQLSEEYQLDEINLYKSRSTIISEIQSKEKEIEGMIRAARDMRKEGLTIEDGYLEKLQEEYLAHKAILDLIDPSAEEPIDRQRMYDINEKLDTDYMIDVIDSQKSEVTLLQEANTEKEKAIAYEAQLLAMQKQGVTVTEEQLALAKKDIEQWTLRWKLLGGTEKEKSTETARSNSLYDERIKVIDDMNKKYRELAKTLPDVEAKQGAFNAYIDAFAEAYKDIKWIPSNVREMTPEQFAEQVLNFPNEDDLVAFLDKLAKEPMKAFEKIKVELAKGEYVLDAKVRVKKEGDAELKKSIQELFDQYDLSLELKKLNIPKDLAKSLFDVDYLDLDGLKKAVQDQEAKFIGTDMEDEYKKFLEKIDDMEDKAAKERMKTYVKYLQEGMSERVKLKIEELRKLKEIEESDEFTPAQKERIKANVSKEARAEQQAQEWKDFQGSEMYTLMFEDLEFLGTKALVVLKEKLEELKGSLKDLPASEVKEIINQISRIEDVMIERNPFASMRDAMKEVQELQAKGRTEEMLQITFADAEAKRKSYQEELDAINLVLNAKDKVGLLNEVSEEWMEKYGFYLEMQTGELEKQSIAYDALATGQEMVATNAKNDLDAYADARKSLEAVANEWNTFKQLADSAWGSAKTIMESLGVESDSLAITIGDTAMNMVDLVFQAIMFDLQLKALTMQATALGIQMNAALGPIGWIVLALQAVATLLSAIFGAKDKALQKQVEKHKDEVENLQKAYEKLENSIDDAWDVASIRQYNAELKATTQSMIEAQKAAIAAQSKRKGANKEGSDAYNELQEMKAELDELQTQLDESLANSFSKVTDGILDSVHDAAREFTDAWWDAFVETGDGLKGLEENFNEIFLNLAKNQAAMQITGAFADRWKKDLEKYINVDDTELTKDEAREWAQKVRDTFPELSAALEGYLGAFKDMATEMDAAGLSALQKGIHSLSESTGQVIESLLNSLRFYVADSNQELKNQTRYMRDLYNLLNGMTMAHSQGGRGIKVVM